MANPKRKWSKARTSRHRALWKLSVPGLVDCPQCHAKKLAHKACKACGYYNGREVLKVNL
jgi:large subunit ribosomal protein L32